MRDRAADVLASLVGRPDVDLKNSVAKMVDNFSPTLSQLGKGCEIAGKYRCALALVPALVSVLTEFSPWLLLQVLLSSCAMPWLVRCCSSVAVRSGAFLNSLQLGARGRDLGGERMRQGGGG